MQRCYILQDSIYNRESESKAQEYAALFETQEKELQLTEERAQSQRKTILIVSSMTLVVLLLFILWIVVYNLRKTKERNRIDAKRIDDLIAQKEELRKAYALSHDISHPNADSEVDKEYQTFMRMESIIVEKQMFLNPELLREDILKATGIGKNSLVPIIRKYTGCVNLNDYINRLRVEYAVKMIKENTLFTMDSIAEASGFNSRSTFYRVFQNVFGMTPSQYLETKKQQDQEI